MEGQDLCGVLTGVVRTGLQTELLQPTHHDRLLEPASLAFPRTCPCSEAVCLHSSKSLIPCVADAAMEETVPCHWLYRLSSFTDFTWLKPRSRFTLQKKNSFQVKTV